jgi:hypothetical protein
MKKIFLLVVLMALMPSGGLGRLFAGERSRVIVTTDGEADAKPGDTIHFVCTVTDDGTPAFTRYARVVVTVR